MYDTTVVGDGTAHPIYDKKQPYITTKVQWIEHANCEQLFVLTHGIKREASNVRRESEALRILTEPNDTIKGSLGAENFGAKIKISPSNKKPLQLLVL
jgi:hypothetical protein